MRNRIAVCAVLACSAARMHGAACEVEFVTVVPQKLISQAIAGQRTATAQPVTQSTLFEITIDFKEAVKTPPIAGSFTLTLLPGNDAVPATAIRDVAWSREDPRRLRLDLNPIPGFDPQRHTQLRIVHGGVELACGKAPLDVTKNIALTADQLQEEFQRVSRLLDDVEAAAAPADQRHIYAAFAAVKGEGGDAEGAADIVINQRFMQSRKRIGAVFDSADVKLIVKKNSGANADPRNYTTGVELTKAFLFGAARRARIATAGRPALPAGPMLVAPGSFVDPLSRAAQSASNGWFRGLVINEFVKMEGDAFDFKTVNFVTDTQFTLPSIAKPLRRCAPAPCVASSFFAFRVLAGPELGKNMRDPEDTQPAGAAVANPSKAVDYILRTKVGADLTIRVGRSEANASDFALELDLAYVNRWLHRAEPVLQDVTRDGQTVQERVLIQKGTRPWRQADLKLFLFGNETVRYGIRFSFYSGSLPPTFAKTRALQIGLVIQKNGQASTSFEP